MSETFIYSHIFDIYTQHISAQVAVHRDRTAIGLGGL